MTKYLLIPILLFAINLHAADPELEKSRKEVESFGGDPNEVSEDHPWTCEWVETKPGEQSLKGVGKIKTSQCQNELCVGRVNCSQEGVYTYAPIYFDIYCSANKSGSCPNATDCFNRGSKMTYEAFSKNKEKLKKSAAK